MNSILNQGASDEPFLNITRSNVSEYSSKDSENSSPISSSLPIMNNQSIIPSINNLDLQAEQQRKSRLAGPSSKKVKFTKAEDVKLMMLVQEFSTKDWKTIAEHMFPRTARQCRERWTNYVNPMLSKDPWSKEEDLLLIEKHNEFGNRWKLIERYFPGRSKNNIKHRWSIMKDLHIAPEAAPKAINPSTPVASNGFIDFPMKSSRSTHSPVSIQTLQLMQVVTQQQKMIAAASSKNSSNQLPIFQMQAQQKLLLQQAVAAAHAAAHAAAQQQNQVAAHASSSINNEENDVILEEDPTSTQNQNSTTILPSIQNFTSSAPVHTPILSGSVISSSPMPIPSINSVLIQPSISAPSYALKLTKQGIESADHFKMFDRVIDQHDIVVASEIEKPDMWTFPEESYF